MRADTSLTVAPFEAYDVKPFGPMSSDAKSIHAKWRRMEALARTTKVDAGHKAGDREARKQVAERIAGSTVSHAENDDRTHMGERYAYTYHTAERGKAEATIALLEPRILGMWGEVERHLAAELDATLPHCGSLASEWVGREMAATMRRLEEARERLATARVDAPPESDGGYTVKPGEIRALSDAGRAWFRRAQGTGWRKLAHEQEVAGWARVNAARAGLTTPVAEPSLVKACKLRKAQAVAVVSVIPDAIPNVSGDYLTPADDSTSRMFAALECDQLVLLDGQAARDWYASDAARWTVRLSDVPAILARVERINTPAPMPVARKRGRPTNASKADDLLMQALAILEGADPAEYDAADKAVSTVWERRTATGRSKRAVA